MPEYLKENDHPLNQASKKALLKVKEKPEPTQLYCLQLAEWALDSGQAESRFPVLQENLQAMLGWDQKEALQFLLEGENPEDRNDILGDAEDDSPLSLAVAVLESLHSTLSANLAGYPRPNQPLM